jgi:integrase
MDNPGKPRSDFPLTPCGNGMWRKIVRGKPYTFGSWRQDPLGEAALKEWIERRDAIHAGLDHVNATAPVAGKTVIELTRWYLSIRTADVKAGRLAPETYYDYVANLSAFAEFAGSGAKAAGLKPHHFAAYRAKLDERKLGPHAVKRTIANVKAMLNYAMAEGVIPAIQYGRSFVAPPTDDAALATHYERTGKTNKREVILTSKQVRKLLRSLKDKPFWKAIVLVMLNTAMNPSEISRLRWTELNLKNGRLSRRRWKKGIRQEAYLWKITRAALEALTRSGEWVFVNEKGKQLVKCHAETAEMEHGEEGMVVRHSNRLTPTFRTLADAAGLPMVTPYTLRRTARTWAAHCHDDNAAKRMMGQALSGQDSTYVKGKFPLARLKKLSLTILARLTRKPQVKPGQMRMAS